MNKLQERGGKPTVYVLPAAVPDVLGGLQLTASRVSGRPHEIRVLFWPPSLRLNAEKKIYPVKSIIVSMTSPDRVVSSGPFGLGKRVRLANFMGRGLLISKE